MYRIVDVDVFVYREAVSDTLNSVGSDVDEAIASSVEIPEGLVEAVMAVVSHNNSDWRKLFTIKEV